MNKESYIDLFRHRDEKTLMNICAATSGGEWLAYALCNHPDITPRIVAYCIHKLEGDWLNYVLTKCRHITARLLWEQGKYICLLKYLDIIPYSNRISGWLLCFYILWKRLNWWYYKNERRTSVFVQIYQ